MVELMVVVIIVGIMAAVAIPKYLKSVEMSKADSGSSQMKMVGAANRMYAIDHSGLYVSGIINTACNTWNGGTCKGDGSSPCDLVACKYLPANDYTNMAYQVAAGANAACALGGGGGTVACALRNSSQSPSAPYNAWGYTMDVNGVVYCLPSGTNGCTGASDPPMPSQ
jgi:Tfp pilus assembly protein PilE